MEIGKLKEVEIRDLWKHEQYVFLLGFQKILI